MKIEVKLYSYHDMDLVSLYKTGRVSFPETTRQILNSYANKEAYKVRLLEVDEKRLTRYPSDSYRKYYHYHVVLDEKDDADAVGLLKRITPGYRNNFIKAILRQYLCGVFISDYSINGDSKFFDEMSRRFQGDREERDIKLERKKKRKKQKQAAGKKVKPKSINGEREIPGRQKVVRESNAQALTSHAGLNPSSKRASLSHQASLAALRAGNEREARVIKNNEVQNKNQKLKEEIIEKTEQKPVVVQEEVKEAVKAAEKNVLKKEEPAKMLKTEESDYNTGINPAPVSQNEDDMDDFDDDFDDFLGGTTEQF